MSKRNTSNNKQIVFFDGVCALCNKFVDFIIQRDFKNRYLFAPLQGTTAAEKIPSYINSETVILLKEGTVYTRSSAALIIISSLGGVWTVFKVFMIIPKFFRDFIYKSISKNRYKWFGQKESCRIPLPHERLRFLD